MGCPKGVKHRSYTPEEKLDIVKMNTEQYLSPAGITKITGISEHNVRRWIRQYSKEGTEGLRPKGKRGTPSRLCILPSP